ncbi:MAG: Ku domain-containing protein [Sulfobacillus acidophilus]|uniref:Ku domain-containing protein n=1 Tax=Sulfobacillus acidophilus TaxID=53633 RepID=A0A2T2WKT3_9FIRM|nr:MAG: Ku domain-containing protein [Sulfobacillus acidophilus]
MRSLYRGIIGFGLVAIPIQLFKAMDSERVDTHWIHTPCATRIHYQKYCPICEKVVPAEEVGTGAQLPDGRVVMLPPEPYHAVSDHTISILNFPKLAEIDPVLWDAAYWLEPGPGGDKPYALLVSVMRELNRVALAEMTLRTRTSLAVIRPYNATTLMLHRMYYPEALRGQGAQRGPDSVALSEQELAMARTLVQYLAHPFVPDEYPNHRRQLRLRQIEALLPTATTPKTDVAPEVIDLMERLKASVDAQKQLHAETP